MSYNPLVSPAPEQWLKAGESLKLHAVIRCHKQARIHLPQERGQAAIHLTVENQAARGDKAPGLGNVFQGSASAV